MVVHSDSYHLTININYFFLEDNSEKMKQILQ